MNKIVLFLAAPYSVGIFLFFCPSIYIERIYGEKNFAYMNGQYFFLVIGALAFTTIPFLLLQRKKTFPQKSLLNASSHRSNGPSRFYTATFVISIFLLLSSAVDLSSYRENVTGNAFIVDIFEIIVIMSLAKQSDLRRADIMGVVYVAILNVLMLRRYALIPFLLIVFYLIRDKVKLKGIVRNGVLIAIIFLCIQFVREAGGDGLPVLTLSSAYIVLPWNRFAMIISGILEPPFSGHFFYSFTSFFLPPGLPAGSLIWNDGLGVPTKDILSQDLEYKTLHLLKEGYLPINWFTLLGDLYSDMEDYLFIYVGVIAILAALAMRTEHKHVVIKIVAAYTFTALVLVGTYNILMFPRFVWMLIAVAAFSVMPRVRIFK